MPPVQELSGIVVVPPAQKLSGIVVVPPVQKLSGIVVVPPAQKLSSIVVVPPAQSYPVWFEHSLTRICEITGSVGMFKKKEMKNTSLTKFMDFFLFLNE